MKKERSQERSFKFSAKNGQTNSSYTMHAKNKTVISTFLRDIMISYDVIMSLNLAFDEGQAVYEMFTV